MDVIFSYLMHTNFHVYVHVLSSRYVKLKIAISRKNASALWNFYSSPVKTCISEYFFWLQSSVEVIIFKCVGDHRPRTSSLEREDSCLSAALDLTSEPLLTACNDWSTEIIGPRFVKLFFFS